MRLRLATQQPPVQTAKRDNASATPCSSHALHAKDLGRVLPALALCRQKSPRVPGRSSYSSAGSLRYCGSPRFSSADVGAARARRPTRWPAWAQVPERSRRRTVPTALVRLPRRCVRRGQPPRSPLRPSHSQCARSSRSRSPSSPASAALLAAPAALPASAPSLGLGRWCGGRAKRGGCAGGEP